MESPSAGPLQGLRILDISTIVAAPLSATLLADLGASVVKVEKPGSGDPLRELAPHKDGVGLWWKVANRNKKGITIDLRRPDGRDLFERLLPNFDVLVENFRPGTLDRWGLTRERLFALQPKLTILRVTGFGQTGPYRDKPAFARVAEAIAGLTYICGEPGRTPMHLGYPIADAVTGLFGAVGVLGALFRRLREPDEPGQEIDVSLTESTFRMLDFLAIEYDQLGTVRERSGNLSAYSAPSNVYRSRDGIWITIPASSQTIFERLCNAMGRPDLILDSRFGTNRTRLQNRDALDVIIAGEVAMRSRTELQYLLDQHAVGWAPVNSIADIFEDPQFAARDAIVRVPDPELGTVRMQNVLPIYSATPGRVATAGPMLGEHNKEIFSGWLGLGDEELERLKRARAI